ncbi:26635_t:CDS:2, partial [Dentiscutata erythropus]
IELFDDTKPINATTYEASNELLNILNDLNDAMNEDNQSGIGYRLIFATDSPDKADYQDGIDHELIFDTDSSDEESDIFSLKIMLGQPFDTWNDAETFLNKYELEKVGSVVVRESINQRRYWIQMIRGTDNLEQQIANGDAQSIRRLLRKKFPERKIYQKGLYNSIQIAKKKSVIQVKFDASDFMRHLYSHRTENLHWFVEAKFEKDERRLCGLVWLLSEQQNLWTCYHDILFFDITSCTNKYNMMACFFVIIDNCNRTRLVATTLLEDETESSFKIQELLNKKSEYARIKEYKEQIPTIGLPTITKTYFNSLEKVVSQYLLLVMECININDIKGTQEDNYEIAKIYLADIISTIKHDQIKEI